jgi:hypothetical protein
LRQRPLLRLVETARIMERAGRDFRHEARCGAETAVRPYRAMAGELIAGATLFSSVAFLLHRCVCFYVS